jgi:hypothetical protein
VALEQAMKARANKEGIKHSKKFEEFLKAVKDLKSEAEIKSKFREILVKSNCLKENDDLSNEFINLVVNS